MYYYLNEDRQPVKVKSLVDENFIQFSQKKNFNRVRRTFIQIPGKPRKVKVSTAFLTIDHGYLGGAPVLFETAIFGLKDTAPQPLIVARYLSWDDAAAGHKVVLRAVKRKQFNDLA